MSAEEKPFDPVEFYFDGLLRDLEDIIGDGQLTTLNVLSTCVNLMQLVERKKNISGKQKKELVLKVLRRYIFDHGGEESILSILPDFIDTAVSLDKGEVTIKVDMEKVSGCCLSMCSSFVNKKKDKQRKN